MFYQLPYGVFAVALATALFPELSEAAERKDWSGFKAHLRKGLTATALLILPSAALLVALSKPLVTLYVAGRFPIEAIPLVAGVLSVWALGLFSYASYMLVLRSFYAMQDSRTPAITNAFLTVAQVALYAGLTSIAAWGEYRLLGIPATDAIVFTAHAAVLLAVLRSRIGAFDGPNIASSVGRTAIGALAGGGAAWLTLTATAPLSELRAGFLLQLLAGGIVGFGVSYGVAAVLRVPELSVALSMVRKATGRFRPGRTLPPEELEQ
jgi:putative peptidoglycan lipid II flippase